MKTYGILYLLGLSLLGTASVPAIAQVREEQVEVELLAAIDRVHLLDPAAPSVTGTVKLDSAATVRLVFGSPSKTLDIDLTAPDGTRISLGDPDSAVATNSVFPDPSDPDTTGANYLFVLSNPQPGSWTYEIRETVPLIHKRAVLLNVFSGSAVRSALLGGGEDYRLDREVRLALLTVEGSSVLQSVDIAAEVRRIDAPGGAASPVPFRDDGQGGDEVAGDGMFTAALQPGTPGEYRVAATVTGTTESGEAFERDSVAGFRVQPVRADIARTFTDRGIDLDGDGLLDQIGVSPVLDVVDAGEYRVTVTLRAGNGQTLAASRVVDFAAGTFSPEVLFATDDIRSRLAADGPYDVAEVRLEFLPVDLAVTADAAFDLGPTAAYRLNQLQRQAIEFLGSGGAAGVDTNGNGRFDFLDVALPVEFLAAGSYQWSARLVDSNGKELALASGSGTFDAGTATLILRFEGLPIGQNGVDGPYFVRNLIVFGEDESLVIDDPMTTPLFQASQFEGGPVVVVEVPSLDSVGMIVLVTLLAVTSLWLLRRQQGAI
ncbi:MAG TPA: choice-of-anchor X domain-containing protein [Thermoanaerobaculia bacterium]|nr:choice-of-anchor X domain-containing protein [Thermoanaerobaculia bacterium]